MSRKRNSQALKSLPEGSAMLLSRKNGRWKGVLNVGRLIEAEGASILGVLKKLARKATSQ